LSTLSRLRTVKSELMAKAVAIGVPRVSGERPRLTWKVLTKSRWSPRSAEESERETVAMTLKPSRTTSPQPPTSE